jgi:hypothetical protein
LVIQHKIADRIRQLPALPLTFLPACAFTLADWRGRAYRLDRVGCSTELVSGDMRHRCGLAGSIGGVPSGSSKSGFFTKFWALAEPAASNAKPSSKPWAVTWQW